MTPTRQANSRPLRRTIRLITTAVSAALLVAACASNTQDQSGNQAAVSEADTDGFNGTLVDPPLRPTHVTLKDTQGNPVRLDHLPANKATALFFGFTNCDDICPTTMADLASARRALAPALAERVAVYFVTVDPRRDTPSVLQTWLNQFDSDMVGLGGPTRLVHRAERSLYAAESSPAAAGDSASRHHDTSSHHDGQSRASASGGSDYEFNHSGSVYVFGPDGETLLYTGGTTVNQYAADFTRLLHDS
jgi:protein SCO1/2